VGLSFVWGLAVSFACGRGFALFSGLIYKNEADFGQEHGVRVCVYASACIIHCFRMGERVSSTYCTSDLIELN
jgi:hypothetical protein